MPYRHLRLRHRDRLAILELHRPEKHNALNTVMLEELKSTIARLAEDDAVDGLLITGSGDSFCSGADIGVMRDLDPAAAEAFAALGQEVLFALEELGKPVLAAVHGHCIGGGLEIALACDFIIAAESASFSFPEMVLGIIPGFGGTQRLPRLVGKAKAKELIFTGDRINAAEAHNIGLVNRLYSSEKLVESALSLLSRICERGPLSLRLAKEMVEAGYDIDLRTACLMERDAFALCFTTEEQKEGMSAFLEKRPPRFRKEKHSAA